MKSSDFYCIMKKSYGISHLFVYPVKGLPGIPLMEVEFSCAGFHYDRLYAIFDQDGRMLTRRNIEGMADFDMALSESGVSVYSARLNRGIEINFKEYGSETLANIWNRVEAANEIDPQIDSFFSAHFGKAVRLLRCNTDTFGPGFHDSSPILIINGASVRALETEYHVSIDIRRFRPNIVIEGDAAFEEEGWMSVSMEEVETEMIKQCSRCIIINQNPETAVVDMNVLSMLSPFALRENKIKFGWYITPLNGGIVGHGQQITVDLK